MRIGINIAEEGDNGGEFQLDVEHPDAEQAMDRAVLIVTLVRNNIYRSQSPEPKPRGANIR